MTREDDARLERLFESFQAVNSALRKGSLAQGGVNITRVQWMILRHVHKHPGCMVGELAERLNVRPSTMSQMLDRLEKVGYVQREAAEADSRIKQVRLTELGQQGIGQVESIWLTRLRQPFARLTAEEQDQLTHLMSKLARFVHEGGTEGGSGGETSGLTRDEGGDAT
ncbi:MAG: MarR family transcriptional regulator [Alicyclobacillus herbarius]|uniref:MarR family winged helix-turn-helix transcriptional regulator n=1 Tax=Alicyclobacillus herbarius TaxID=122960 RepID=UPI002357BA65|nr:MarR family transcriptional regulator [Alicyclobacillus herbarius]MCL6633025.1 MarR family transcriptional regulator [Alicyclobacillus herbarius]